LVAETRLLPFAQITSAEATAIADMALYQRWHDGAVISDFGDPLADAPCFLLIEGNVAVQIALPDGREPLVVHVERPGSVFGTDALYMPSQRFARYVADGDVVCALFTAKSMDAMAQRHPVMAYKLIAMMGALVYRNFRVNVKRLAIDASMHLSEKEQFEGELKAAHYRSKVALGVDPDAPVSRP
jgi:CRP-like cAMP-binding protein